MKIVLNNGNFSGVRRCKEYEVIGIDKKRKMYVIKNDMHSQMAYPISAFEIVEEKVEVVEDTVDEVEREESVEVKDDLVEVLEDIKESLTESEEAEVEEKPVKKHGRKRNK